MQGGTLAQWERERDGELEWRETSRQREGKVPAPGHFASPSPWLPGGGEWKLLPGLEARASRASGQCGVRCLPPPSGAAGPSLVSSRNRAQTPASLRRDRRCQPPAPSPRRCRWTPSPVPEPRPLRSPTLSPPHTSNPAVPSSEPLLRRRRRRSSRCHRVLHPRWSRVERRSPARRSREPGSAASRVDDARPLPGAAPPPRRSALRPSPAPPRASPACLSRGSAPRAPSPAFLGRHHHHYLPRRTSHTNPTHSGSTSVRTAAIG